MGIDPDAASDLFTIMANREFRRPTMIVSQSGPDCWAKTLPDKVAADSIANRLAANSKVIKLGEVDMRRITAEEQRDTENYWQ